MRDWYPTGIEFEYTVEVGGRTVLKVLSHHDLGVDKGDEVRFAYDPAVATCFAQPDQPDH